MTAPGGQAGLRRIGLGQTGLGITTAVLHWPGDRRVVWPGEYRPGADR
jgi:hypothetical protein